MFDNLVEKPLSEVVTLYPNPKRKQMWIGDTYKVQLFKERYSVIRLSVQRNDGEGGIPWEDLQAIKDALGFEDKEAVEIFPKKIDILNIMNDRQLWVTPNGMPFTWRINGDVPTWQYNYVKDNCMQAIREGANPQTIAAHMILGSELAQREGL